MFGFLKRMQEKRTLRQELESMNERELRDIGISRADFDSIVNGKFTDRTE